jgi:hypothetical protein
VYAALTAAANLAAGDQRLLSDNYKSLHSSAVGALAGEWGRHSPTHALAGAGQGWDGWVGDVCG